ncbi:DUF1206 domain-containing protein [Pseudonocardia acidicola]|uniref:DUF1206 domain-containing protein n=1 Tax=Pseudonocardia acidicola TaxID=2724939 RepID=A0ABX1SFK3_9PSEU|nr:DUF1206 domain-containing protein [Pseudonocardia acidicola]NMH98953.1 DUF1206 domain-containing protein [Pseudonocardia acidicola]
MSGPLPRLRRLVREGRSDAPGRAVDLLGRVGLVGYGVVHLLVAWLALQIVAGALPRGSADAQGAVAAVAVTPYGAVALVVTTAGLIAFAVWQFTAAVIGFRWVTGGERTRKRAGAIAKAVAMVGLATVSAGFVDGRGAPSGDPGARTLTADLLAVPAGRVLVALVAAVLFVIAGTMTYTGTRRTFMGDLDVRRLRPAARRGIEWLGVAGHLSRALALAVVGLLMGAAAFASDPRLAGGLDAALRAIGATAPGRVLLAVVALGFGAFGLFCLADAATRRA